MNLMNTLGVGLKEIWAHKFRSILTMLGIILGVSSLVAMSAMVAGMEKGATDSLVAIGALDKFRIESEDVPPEQLHLADQSPGLTLNDVDALRAGVPLVGELSPEIRLRNVTLTRAGNSFRSWRLSGVWPVAVDLNQHVVAYGRNLSALDEAEARSVCVIGSSARDELFGSPEDTGETIIPVGEIIFFNDQPFTVVGMFEHYQSDAQRQQAAEAGQSGRRGRGRDRGYNRADRGGWVYAFKNSTVFIPLNTARLKFQAGQDGVNADQLTQIEVRVPDYEKLVPALQQCRNVLMTTHKAILDFEFRTSEEWAEQVEQFVRNARLSGGMISGVSLLVGGIGIMNIMFASIASRIRELGIRKAVGASNGEIFLQILIESIVIAGLGGLMGLVTSLGLVRLIAGLSPTGNPPIVSGVVLLFAFTCCVTIGLLAGLFPAFKAARLNPISALRYE